MLEDLFDFLAAMLTSKKPSFAVGQVTLYGNGESIPQPAVVQKVRFIRPDGAEKREWMYNLVLIRFDARALVKISTYVSTVSESSLDPVGI